MDIAKENNKTDCVAFLERAATREPQAAAELEQPSVRPWVGASVIVDLVCFVVVSFEGRAFHPIRLYVHALTPLPPTTIPSSPHHHTYSFIDDLYTPIYQSLHPHHLTPTTNLLHLPHTPPPSAVCIVTSCRPLGLIRRGLSLGLANMISIS